MRPDPNKGLGMRERQNVEQQRTVGRPKLELSCTTGSDEGGRLAFTALCGSCVNRYLINKLTLTLQGIRN